MTRILLPLIGTLLALVSSVDAKSKKSRIQLYQFNNYGCQYTPTDRNVDLEEGKCAKLEISTGRLSVKPMFDPTRGKWLDDINTGKRECVLSLYQAHSCTGTAQNFTLPEQLQVCARLDNPERYVEAARFSCMDKDE
jgi:hypothetical protein